MLQRKPRSTTVLAVRYSQLARVPEGLLNFVKIIFPQVGFRLVRLLGQYYYNDNRRCNFVQSHSLPLNDPISQTKNLHTIAIYPASNDVPLVSFTYELYHALSTNVRAIRLSRKTVAESLGEHVLEKQADFRLMHWLNAQEDNYQLVIYECDFDTSTNWTRRCLRQADAIFVVANGEIKPTRQHFLDEHLKMNQDGIRTRKELVLLWKEEVQAPSGTFEWLKGSWFSGHYHIRAPNRGGGARGAAHVGIIRALREHGIPVDIVGGTSIGSMIGGIFASDPNQDLKSIARAWFMMMSSLWRKIWDLTYWHSAIFTGAGFNRSLQDIFGDKYIEDLWLPYFCITTDISTSEMRVHRSGSLWAYSRASMSLAGYLPPLCDPKDGHLLLDGGYVNNLPADVMRNCGARCVIAVDVGAASETDLYNYGDSLSGLWVLCQRLNPWASPVRILGMEEIQSRLAFVSCVQQLELVKKAPYCHYLRPPIDEFQTLDFVKFDTICDRGYQYGTERLSELIKSNANIKSVMNPEKLHLLAKSHLRHESGLRKPSMRNSFTDLAAQISRIPPRKHHGSLKSLADISIYGDSDWDEEEDDIRSESESRRQSDATEIGDVNDDLSRVVTPRI
ncbi:patatin-like phospholipase domain-containing protein [Ditylenchus destructor]|uniref:Patatin-like phospholipase domain-containing protein n=1 Tax=Ditylenchus destructor TaxID=166010 RepID=A0AAD4RDU7_9BILA|nr:patatin-like phospholipase domain-containing protein [Ditylenchus destructor]